MAPSPFPFNPEFDSLARKKNFIQTHVLDYNGTDHGNRRSLKELTRKYASESLTPELANYLAQDLQLSSALLAPYADDETSDRFIELCRELSGSTNITDNKEER